MNHGVVVWFTGLPSSGKSTLAKAVHRRLAATGIACCLLDGDVVRHRLFPELGYTEAERRTFYERLALLAAELANQGLAVLVPATAARRDYRRFAREVAPRFVEVWVTTPLAECERRDNKGLYGRARTERTTVPGVGVAYEPPEHADARATGGEDDECARTLLELIVAEA